MSAVDKLSAIRARAASLSREIRKLQAERNALLKQADEIENEVRLEEKQKQKEKLLTQEFCWSQEIEEKLNTVFHLQQFRFSQREIINCILSRKDCFVIMPTGGGKSLCYQLAAIMTPGFTLVITPLISLMHDQCFELNRLGISCAMIHSDTSKEEYFHIVESMKQPPSAAEMESREKLIFVSPEKLVRSKKLLSVLEHCFKVRSLDHIIVDEAHCCSEWGHDFRPDYKKLTVCKVLFPTTPLIALTATASPKVQQDVEEILQIPQCLTFSCSVNRPNLFYTVKPKDTSQQGVNKQIVDFIEDIKEGLVEGENPIGIVYCLSRKETEEVSKFLNSKGYKTLPYHAQLPPKDRDTVHDRWRHEKVHIIVATIAFGLGINKANVRFVLHHTISKSLESYYQESGRAGRDGNFATCCALYRPTDLGKLSSMVYYQHNAIDKLFDMVKFSCTMTECRKSKILLHFGEERDSNQTICCDNCSRDLLDDPPKQKLLDCVESLQVLCKFLCRKDENVTLLKLVQLWKGLARKSSNIPDTIPCAPKELSLYNCEEIVTELLLEKYLELHFHNTAYSTICYIKATPHFQNMSTDDNLQFFDYFVSFATAKGKTKKRKRTKSETKQIQNVKIPKIFPTSDISSSDKDKTPIKEEKKKSKKKSSEPICIDLVD